MIDFKTMVYLSGARRETEFSGMIDLYIVKLKADGRNILLEHDRYLEERSKENKKPTFENYMMLMKIT
jgi:hypothetical protein